MSCTQRNLLAVVNQTRPQTAYMFDFFEQLAVGRVLCQKLRNHCVRWKHPDRRRQTNSADAQTSRDCNCTRSCLGAFNTLYLDQESRKPGSFGSPSTWIVPQKIAWCACNSRFTMYTKLYLYDLIDNVGHVMLSSLCLLLQRSLFGKLFLVWLLPVGGLSVLHSRRPNEQVKLIGLRKDRQVAVLRKQGKKRMLSV